MIHNNYSKYNSHTFSSGQNTYKALKKVYLPDDNWDSN